MNSRTKPIKNDGVVPSGPKAARNLLSSGAGRVYLIGAGPGDVELLTLKAVRALGEAEIVLIDELVNREVLRFASPRARVIEVGKRAGCKSTPQAFIGRLMVRLARAGKVVARLKGGDPFVFGRGGEEMLALRAAGVPCEVMSGVTAGLGVPATLGIPVTHRGLSHGVTFVSGHLRDDSQPDWDVLARSGTTLVIYMGIANLPRIAGALLAAGMPESTPAAAIRHGTLAAQQQVITSLGRLPQEVAQAGIGSPALIVIGKVVALAEVSALEKELRRVA